jgi:hypothetical protein
MKELGASRRTTKDNVAMKPTKKKLRLPGLPPIDVVSDAKANACDYLVCVPADHPTPFKDNLTGFCCHCGGPLARAAQAETHLHGLRAEGIA